MLFKIELFHYNFLCVHHLRSNPKTAEPEAKNAENFIPIDDPKDPIFTKKEHLMSKKLVQIALDSSMQRGAENG